MDQALLVYTVRRAYKEIFPTVVSVLGRIHLCNIVPTPTLEH